MPTGKEYDKHGSYKKPPNKVFLLNRVPGNGKMKVPIFMAGLHFVRWIKLFTFLEIFNLFVG